MTIFIGGAWPYANGSLHLGHLVSLLPGDVLARYYRLKGEEVLYVSGSDCHGTPISVRAGQQGTDPHEIAAHYHNEFEKCFQKLDFSYDNYSLTTKEYHHEFVKEFFLKLLEKGYLYKKTISQCYCESCAQFLPDRYVEGVCPHCGKIARGDQCDSCSALLDPLLLKNKSCKLCGSEPIEKGTEHFYFALSRLQKQLENYVERSSGWRENAINLSERYLKEGLEDRAATRDLNWGIDIPLQGWEGKKIYVWIEAVLGYLSASKEWAEKNACSWEKFWGENVTSYFVHGKDNIPFHTLILPALLIAYEDLHLPDRILSNEYLTLEGRKISTSNNWAVWVPYILEKYNSDSIRYFCVINAPEKRDADFSWREFIHRHNSELLGDFGNFVNRTLAFIQKSFDGRLNKSLLPEALSEKIKYAYQEIGALIESGEIKRALESAFALVKYSNKYFDEKKPWKLATEDRIQCEAVLYDCVQIIANLSVLLAPFLPKATARIQEFLGLSPQGWCFVETPVTICSLSILFERIDKAIIDEETKQLYENCGK